MLTVHAIISTDLPRPHYPPVNEIQNCTVAVNDTNLLVSCDFNSDSVLGYYVMLHICWGCFFADCRDPGQLSCGV